MKEEALINSPVDIFCHWEKTTPANILFRQPIKGVWKTWTYQQAGNEIRRIAARIQALNLPAGSNIAILSKNCAHWIMADLAIWMAGHISVPLYPTISASTIKQILDHSGTKVIFIGKLDNFSLQENGIADDVKCISFSVYGENKGESWEEIIKKYEPLKNVVNRDVEQVATIKYTSGTTGKPKGVMISFKAIHYILTHALDAFGIKGNTNQSFFSYLPLSHIAERMLVELGALYAGGMISFSESLEKFPQNLMDTQPTVFLAVPRIWSKFQEKILEKMPSLPVLLKIPVINRVVKKTIKKKLGLSRARWMFTGAAPMSKSTLEWFDKLGIQINEVYGMTENLAYSHINLYEVKFGTVGKPWPDVDWKYADDQEILMKHPGLMMGYYKEQQLTSDAFTPDGFFKTGDKGETDNEGFVTITGRVKDQFKTDKAKYIDPSPLELALSLNTDFEQICVVGSGIPQPVVLVVLSASGKTKSKDDLVKSISRSLEILNATLESYERIAKAIILNQDWTIENGLMTPSLKVKRNEIEKIHLSKYAEWYKKVGLVIWE